MPFNQILRVHDVRREIIVYKNVPRLQRHEVANRDYNNNRRDDESARTNRDTSAVARDGSTEAVRRR